MLLERMSAEISGEFIRAEGAVDAGEGLSGSYLPLDEPFAYPSPYDDPKDLLNFEADMRRALDDQFASEEPTMPGKNKKPAVEVQDEDIVDSRDLDADVWLDDMARSDALNLPAVGFPDSQK